MAGWWYGGAAMLWLLSSKVTQASSSSVSWQLQGGIHIRGGGDTAEKPRWLVNIMDHQNALLVEKYKSMARERHARDVQAARIAYFSTEAQELSNNNNINIIMDTYNIIVPAGGSNSLPDFVSELEPNVFVTRDALFTREECQDVIEMAESYFEKHHGGKWTRLPSGQYNVAGFWIKDIPKVHEWFNDALSRRLLSLLSTRFPEFCSADDLVVDNAYMFKYTPETGKRTGIHTDSGCLSFTIFLGGNHEGGGTWFEGLHDTKGNPDSLLEMKQGQVTVRPGGVRHCGHAVTAGTRYIIGGFCMHKSKVEYVRMLIGLGSELSQQEKHEQAQEALEVAIVLQPNFDGAYTHLAQVLEKRGKVDQAKEVLEYCHQHVNPLNGEVAYSLGVLYLEEERYQQAKECLEACVAVDDGDESAMLALAQVCAKQGDKDGERHWYEQVVAIPGIPKDAAASAYCNLGVLSEGEEREIDFYRKALELVPDNFQSRYSLGSAHAVRKEWTEAAESFRLAVGLAASNPEFEAKALNALYHVTLNIIQAPGSSSSSQQEMFQHLIKVMGEENYKKLAASSKGTAQQ